VNAGEADVSGACSAIRLSRLLAGLSVRPNRSIREQLSGEQRDR
jgi:hypothetical protein